jgi:hypothetical protein
VNSIAQLETNICASPEDDVDAFRLQVALGRVTPGSNELPTLPILKKPLPHKLCELICAYKLIDVLYDLQEQKNPTLFENPTYPKHRVSALLPTQVRSSRIHGHYC